MYFVKNCDQQNQITNFQLMLWLCLYISKYLLSFIVYVLLQLCRHTMSFRLCDVKQTLKRRVCLQGRGLNLYHWQSLPPNLRDLWNLIPLNCISYLHKVAMLCFHSFPWKGYNFHRLKDIFCEYFIKRNEGITLLTPIPNRLWTHFVNFSYSSNLYDQK